MKKLWKKPAFKITTAVVVVVALALLALWISSLRTPPAISFNFLNDRIVRSSMEDVKTGLHYNRIIRYSYTLSGGFSDICLSADAELLKLGYGPPTYAGPNQRSYAKHGMLGNSVSVTIRDKIMVKQSNEPDYSSFYSDYSNRWVSVEIFQSRLRLWPPQHLLYVLKMRFVSGRQNREKTPGKNCF